MACKRSQHQLFPRLILLIISELKLSSRGPSELTGTSFFRYCQIHHARVAPRMQDERPRAASHFVLQSKTLPNGQKHEEEVEMLTEFSWRNFFAAINFAKIMQKLSKSRSHRIWMLVQYKSSVGEETWNKVQRLTHPLSQAVLKRVLRVPHPMLQLHVLKLIKSQVPFCGRKWRQCERDRYVHLPGILTTGQRT